MRKTLLIVFIHGFKGDDNTFRNFPEHLRAIISHALPRVDVDAVTYPKFETRGDLKDCVARFRDWLQDKVIDLEVAHGAPSPTVDPSVHVLLVGHSMGGIVGAETIALISSEQPLPPSASMSNTPSAPNFPSNTTQASTTSTAHPTPSVPDGKDAEATESTSSLMFPHIIGLLAFDTPFLGISPGVVAHGAESHYKTATQAYKAFSEVSSIFGWGSASSSGSSTPTKSAGALPAPSTGDAAAAPGWQSLGKYAMFAGAAGAVAAGASAAIYSQKDKLSWGWTWVTGHLEFVGCLARGEELKRRVQNMSDISKERGLGFIDFYTLLGKSASKSYGASEQVLGNKRTFCSIPQRILDGKSNTGESDTNGLQWRPALNDKAKDEIGAHTSMFVPRDNPNFYKLSTEAKDWVTTLILKSKSERSWYQESEERKDTMDGGITHGEVGDDGWEKPDYEADDVRQKFGEKKTTEVGDQIQEARNEAGWKGDNREATSRNHDRNNQATTCKQNDAGAATASTAATIQQSRDRNAVPSDQTNSRSGDQRAAGDGSANQASGASDSFSSNQDSARRSTTSEQSGVSRPSTGQQSHARESFSDERRPYREVSTSPQSHKRKAHTSNQNRIRKHSTSDYPVDREASADKPGKDGTTSTTTTFPGTKRSGEETPAIESDSGFGGDGQADIEMREEEGETDLESSIVVDKSV